MTIAVMQPYIFPYIGYYQLLNASDKFIIYDDVNYINRGWINRNNILVNHTKYLFTIPLKNASQNKLIYEVELTDGDIWRKKLLRTFEMAYKKAPYFREIYKLIELILGTKNSHIGGLIKDSIKEITNYLDIKTEIITSSAEFGNTQLKGQERILDICKKLKADQYINPIGGSDIYSRSLFQDAGIQLNFLQTTTVKYHQFDEEFYPNLSIIDVLMFNSKSIVSEMLKSYELV
jgi:WbqC-like protein family